MKTINKIYTCSINIKKSEFICRLFPVSSEDEVKRIIEEISSEFSDATHNCTAYVLSDSEGYDDDGEPGGTAGKPMLNVLKKNDLCNVLAIVTRYFGGIKLGAGGLVRAYGKSVLSALDDADIVSMSMFYLYSLTFPYNFIKNVDSELRSLNFRIVSKDYSEDVCYTVATQNEDIIVNLESKFQNKVSVSFIKSSYLEV